MLIFKVTNSDTSQAVLINADDVSLIEQKRPVDGGFVAIYLKSGKEVSVTEPLSKIEAVLADKIN